MYKYLSAIVLSLQMPVNYLNSSVILFLRHFPALGDIRRQHRLRHFPSFWQSLLKYTNSCLAVALEMPCRAQNSPLKKMKKGGVTFFRLYIYYFRSCQVRLHWLLGSPAGLGHRNYRPNKSRASCRGQAQKNYLYPYFKFI